MRMNRTARQHRQSRPVKSENSEVMAMAKSDELLNLDVVALSEHFRARELSPVEVTEAYLKRIEETEQRLHAYVTVTADVARNSARDAEKEIIADAGADRS